ncbi:MaoC family dehydratase [Nocardia bhagyanarayanae]|uniref:Acyl dehydratase n=1 Tax=Nocardia bhagyanarayanae TaxID=1215925 RepID=A0A543EXX5_9NOCA|nr:MaoC family dehydratase [Nocardia bhagyanarayanae]TQM26440.1 acyl dehydratase [Nocardia bhagyanarayanae]
MRTFHGVAELEAAVGSHLGYSEWHTVTQSQIDAFADATGDHQWIHIDAEKAANGPFGTTIAHGYLTLSLVPLLVAQVYRVEGVAMMINYGANKLRFPAPAPVDSKVRAGVELVSVAASAAGHLVTAKVTIEREGGDKPVCVVESLTLVVG